MFKKILFLFTLLFLILSCSEFTNPLHRIIDEDPFLKKIADQNSGHEVQILYTRIGSDEDGYPTFSEYVYQVDEEQYFYPASTVKMPVAFLALEKLNRLDVEGLDRKTTMLVDSVRPPQSNAHVDTSNQSGLPTIERYIEKIFVASDNDAYNRLYEFLGQEYINTRLREIGAISNSKIVHRLESAQYTPEDNRHTNRVRFVDGNEEIYVQESQYCDRDFDTNKKMLVRGKGYYKTGELVKEAFDFTQKNALTIRDMDGILKRITHPESFSESERFDLSREQYNFLLKTMSTLPHESGINVYQDSTYFDSYVKFFLFGDSKDPIPQNIKIYNKVGQAYGFLIDCAFIQDTENDLQFFLTAYIHVNEDQIFNDNQYEYDEIGFPFLAQLGRKVYEYELEEKKKSSR